MEEQPSVVIFRLEQMENTIRDIDGKIDKLLSQQQEYVVDVALVKQTQGQLETRITQLESKATGLQDTTTDIRIGLAQKLGPGAIAGGVVAAVMFIIKLMTGI